MLNELRTPRGEILPTIPWNTYPRPQLRRDSFLCLNGLWEFGTDERCGRTILVPFCPESALSGIKEHFAEGQSLYYRRKFSLPEGFRKERVLLHIGAADQNLWCSVNGRSIGSHRGGYTNITFDITHALAEGENELTIRCTDDLKDQSCPYGKQTLNRGGMWYTPVSGIWQTVWLESVPELYIEKLNIENRGACVTIDVGRPIPGTVTVEGLGSFRLEEGRVTIAPEKPHFWSPEDPYLYDFTVEAGEDRVHSYFALRTLEVKNQGGYPRLFLNGKPYFFHGLLDQGYWPEGLLTPPAPESYADDIRAMKNLGFNTLRKHIKVEAEEFYYQCDKLGMIVFQDMVNNGDYNFLRDTALPTALFQRLGDKNLHKDPDTRKLFLETMEKTVLQLKNHPSILYWTIFNEGWGQFDSDTVYDAFKKLDDTRWIDTTSGWFRRKKTDVDSRHVYFRKVRLKGDRKKPLVLSEFGGKTYRAEGHIFNPDKTYGYGGCENLAALNDEIEALYRDEIIPAIRNGLCAAVYTQVSDVEDEINGLLTYDRKLCKLERPRMLAVARDLQATIREEEV